MNCAATSKVLPSSAHQPSLLSSQSYAKPKFIGPQNRRDGKHADAMIRDFRALLNNMWDAIHRMTIYNAMQELIKHKSRKKTYISDDQLHRMELCIYHGIKVQVEGLEGECKSQICRCTGNQSCHRWDWWNDWSWVRQCPGRYHGVLNGCLPWQLQRRFNLKLLNEDGAFVESWWALALTTIPANSGNLDPISKFVQVRNSPAADALQVVSVEKIVGCTYVVQEIASTSKTDDGLNKRWIVNRHIDLATWIEVYI